MRELSDKIQQSFLLVCLFVCAVDFAGGGKDKERDGGSVRGDCAQHVGHSAHLHLQSDAGRRDNVAIRSHASKKDNTCKREEEKKKKSVCVRLLLCCCFVVCLFVCCVFCVFTFERVCWRRRAVRRRGRGRRRQRGGGTERAERGGGRGPRAAARRHTAPRPLPAPESRRHPPAAPRTLSCVRQGEEEEEIEER